jgi:hypothetical protein|tara:strand:- start:399 stop:593 length:195 start_codon:yes stop_codon:yes gene_type:complete
MDELDIIIKNISDMDVPKSRIEGLIDGTKIVHLRWFNRNLGIRNSDHPKYKSTMNLIVKEIKRS